MRKVKAWLLPAVLATALAAQQNDGSAAKFLNLVEQDLLPGRSGSYQALETTLAQSYEREGVGLYWIELQSLTGPAMVIYLNLWDTMSQGDAASQTLETVLTSHPNWANDGDRLIQENVSQESDTLLERRDDLGYLPGRVNFARARILRIATVNIRPGQEAALATILRNAAVSSARDPEALPWVTYRAISGQPQPTYLVITPLPSLSALDVPSVRNNPLPDATGMGDAVSNVEVRLYAIMPAASHVSSEFASIDPDFWRPKQ